MELLGNRKENYLFSLPWLLDKRESGNITSSLGEAEQINPGVGGQQTSTLSKEKNHGLLRRAGNRQRASPSRWWEERSCSQGQRSLCRAAVSQEAGGAQQNPVMLWANLSEIISSSSEQGELLSNSCIFVHVNLNTFILYVVKRSLFKFRFS